MKQDWIAVFEDDFDARVFLEPGKSEDVMYWIKRFENGKIHTAVSTGNRYALRSFEFFDKNFNLVNIKFSKNTGWMCTKVEEPSLDAWGSNCFCHITDVTGRSFKVRISGMYNCGNHQIRDVSYFTALMIFLEMLYEFEDWKDLEKKSKKLYIEITTGSGIPISVFEEVYQNYLMRPYKAQRISIKAKKSFAD